MNRGSVGNDAVKAPMHDPAQRAEIDANYDFLQRELARILPSRQGQYALIKGCEFAGFYDRPGEAYREGLARFDDGLFSIQEVTDEPLHLGFFSLAGS